MRKQLLLSTLCIPLIIALSCEKNRPDPECRDVSCCYPEYNRYREDIVDVAACLTGPPQFADWAFIVKKGYPTDRFPKSRHLHPCETSLSKIEGFKADLVTMDSSQMTYSYRISGKVFEDTIHPNIVMYPGIYFSIDKVEKIN
ncbi:hypothetical protein [Dyadobacter bucti]|uniref:hypothetical protein n=1 Tax=Dyadobacter bucti TaxID=2572203 RepID=UPI001109AF96|nr:hypothetical protein [Dyadobacter bucti]